MTMHTIQTQQLILDWIQQHAQYTNTEQTMPLPRYANNDC
jgi:hypothetical protein